MNATEYWAHLELKIMVNPKTELLRIREIFPQYSIQCALLWSEWDDHTKFEEWVLKIGHTEQDYQKWLDSIDFECDGKRNADKQFTGFVWLDDDAWFEWHFSRWLIRQRPPLLRCVMSDSAAVLHDRLNAKYKR